MLRLLFTKQGNAIWISHLDLMRIFQRAFKRAGFSLTHTQGFNPRPSVSIALPLSVAVESSCELLDFELEGEERIDCQQICQRLNDCLIDGVKVLEVYEKGRKIRDISYLQSRIVLEYDNGVPEDVCDKINALFQSASVMVEKKSKNGIQEQNIVTMIRDFQISKVNEFSVEILMIACCQNPSLNPMQIVAAIVRHLPECAPDFSKCYRIEIFDNNMEIFR